MAQDYSVDWVGSNTRQWQSQHGPMLDYKIALAGEEGTVDLTQKPDTPAPTVGQQLHGYIETKTFTRQSDGESFEKRVFIKEQRQDGTSSGSGAAPTGHSDKGRSGSASSPGPEFWAAKDRRLARAGMTQAVVASHPTDPKLVNTDLPAYVAFIARITDALLEDLEKRTPSPNNSPSTLASSPASVGSAGTPRPAGERVAPPDSAPAPDLSDLKLALAACGHDNADPERTFTDLNPDQKAQVKLIVSNLKTKGEAGVLATISVNDDESIPF